MGSVYAGILGAAGNDVWAIDLWAEHVAAIRSRGLTVEGASGMRTVVRPSVASARWSMRAFTYLRRPIA